MPIGHATKIPGTTVRINRVCLYTENKKNREMVLLTVVALYVKKVRSLYIETEEHNTSQYHSV